MDINEKINRTVIFLEELEPDVLPYIWEGKVYSTPREYLFAAVSDLENYYINLGDTAPLTEMEILSALAMAKGVALAKIFDKVIAKTRNMTPSQLLQSLDPPEDKDELN